MELFFTKSKIFLYFCLSFAIGILSASFLPIPNLVLFSAAIVSVIFISIFWRNRKIVIAGFCLIFLALGIYRFQSAAEEKSFISAYNDSKENIIIHGIVSEEPDVRIKDAQYIIQTRNVIGTGLPRPVATGLAMTDKEAVSQDKNLGKILITLSHYPAYQYGYLIELEGKLKTPAEFDTFSYKDYLAKDGIYSVMYLPSSKLISSGSGNFVYATIFKVKNKFKEKIKAVLPEPESSLLAGLLLGERSGLGQDLKDDFAITGTSHIVAVSGFNVTIIAVIILGLALAIGFSRGQSFWISLAAIILFIIMVGAPASAVRAGVMGGLVLIAIRAGRLNSMTNAITFAAVAMMALNPKILRFDAGFQLSFLAVVGIVWFYPVLDKYFSNKNKKDIKKEKTFFETALSEIKSAFLLTFSAQIMAMPILLGSFGNLSLVAPFANIMILPFVPLAMGLGFLAGSVGFFWLAAAKVLGYFTWLVLTYQIRIIEYLADLPWASIQVNNFDFVFFILYYLVIGMILVWSWRKRKSINEI